MADMRTLQERERGYPPPEATVIRRCTVPVVGKPHRFLFGQVEEVLVDYLNTPGLRPEDLFASFHDATGSFVRPSLQDTGPGRWLRHFGLHPDNETASKMIDAHPGNWLDILRVPGIGPDTFYDMFAAALVRWIRGFGQALGVYIYADGMPIEKRYLAIVAGAGINATKFVRVVEGLAYDVDSGDPFAFPSIGEYVIASARPSVDYPDETQIYGSMELTASSSSRIRVTVPVAEPVIRIGLASNMLRVFHDPSITAISVHPSKPSFPAKHVAGPKLRDEDGNPISNGQGYVAQEELENNPVATAAVDPDSPAVVFHDLPPGRYLVGGRSDTGIIVTTVRDVWVEDDAVVEVGLDHTFDLARLVEDPPPKAFLQGDIVRQDQGGTQWCGPYSLAHAFSYWAPHRFNPRADNGNWVGETVRDRPETWAHAVLGVLALGGIVALTIAWPPAGLLFAGGVFTAAKLIDDPVPGTLQETMVRGCSIFGFSSQGLTYKDYTKADALKALKQWIAAGIPVVVTVDEKMDKGDGHWSSEHYKTLVGYDDNASFRYSDDDGNEHTSTGAFYFANSGGMGENRGDPDVLKPEERETHADYRTVPIGAEADSYTVFYRKWETGSIPTFSKSHWCLPVFPVNFERVYGAP